MLSRCFLDCSVGVGIFVKGLSQISSFFAYANYFNNVVFQLLHNVSHAVFQCPLFCSDRCESTIMILFRLLSPIKASLTSICSLMCMRMLL